MQASILDECNSEDKHTLAQIQRIRLGKEFIHLAQLASAAWIIEQFLANQTRWRQWQSVA